MEFLLSFNNGSEELQLPVPPVSYEIKKGNINKTVNINDVGEINLIGKPRLATITLSTFFPNKEYSFCQYTGFPKPYECVKLIENWRQSGKPIRLIITNTNINLPVAIEGFSYGERDGSGDVYFSLELKEYKFLSISDQTSATTTVNTTTITRPVEKEQPTSYTVKTGDSLWLISKKLFGDGSKWTELANKNDIKDPTKLIAGQKLVV